MDEPRDAEIRDAALPPSRRAFVPDERHRGPADWRTALRARLPLCGIGVSAFAALILAGFWSTSQYGQPWTAIFGVAAVLSTMTALTLIALLTRRKRRSRDGLSAR